MKKLIILLAALGLLAAACGTDPTDTGRAEQSATADAPESAEAPESTEAPAPDDPSPQRIVSISPTGTEMLFAIGAGDQVIAVDTLSYYPPEAPVTDLSAFEPNVESIASFEPDLVVLDFDPGDLVSGLEAVGIPTAVVPAASTFDDIYAEIVMLGEITGHEGAAADLVAQMQADIDTAVSAHDADTTGFSFYHEIDTTFFSLTTSTFAGQVYALFGLINIADAEDPQGASFGYPQLSEEYILDADPDLIFLADVVFESQNLDTLAARAGWETLSAIQNGNVVELNDDIVSRWGPRVVDYVQAISEALTALKAAA